VNKKTLIVIAGPTGIGKTALSIRLANHFHSEIISADSRQVYQEMKIGTARPSEKELASVKHHLIGHISIHEDYNAGKFENESLTIINSSQLNGNCIFLVGGTGLFIDAVVNGLDEFPAVDEITKVFVRSEYSKNGVLWLQEEIQKRDPVYFQIADVNNPQRLMRALEICIVAGRPYSDFRKGNKKERNFSVIKIFINEQREKLYGKINERTLLMMEKGWMKEAEELFPFRKRNALNTVGYKDLFDVIENKITLQAAIEKIKQNTRRYAKRQITWFKNSEGYTTFSPNEDKKIIAYLEKSMQKP
jgi:tRNA dimethylallyltransferase